MDGYELARPPARVGLPGPGPRASSPSQGYGQATDQQRSAEAGFDAHLVKPVNPTS